MAAPIAPTIRPLRLPSFGVRPFVRYLNADAHNQRQILWDHKYPDPEGAAQAQYYSYVTTTVREFHRLQRPDHWLAAQIVRMQNQAALIGGPASTKWTHNARAVSAFRTNFSAQHLPVNPAPRLSYQSSGVRVSVQPEIAWRVRGRDHLAVFNFRADPTTPAEAAAIAQIVLAAAINHALDSGPATIHFLDCAAGMETNARAMTSRLQRNIDAACANIRAIWPTL